MITIHVCIGSACHVKGSYNVINGLQRIIGDRGLSEKVTINAALCLGKCTEGVSVKIEDGDVISVQEKGINEFFDTCVIPVLGITA